MSAQTYEPLAAVIPLQTKLRMGVLLIARENARRAFDAVLAAPRAAAGYVAGLFQTAGLARTLTWLRGWAGWLAAPLTAAVSRLGRVGILAGAVEAVTSPAGQAVLRMIGNPVCNALTRVAGATYCRVDRVLRRFGQPGRTTANTLSTVVGRLLGATASVTAQVANRVGQVVDARTPQARFVNGLARSVLVHRVLKALVRNAHLRVLVEGLVLPIALQGGTGQWLRAQLRTVRLRALSLRQEAATLTPASTDARNRADDTEGSDDGYAPPMAAGEDVPMPLWLVDAEPTPSNRAQRRAQQRHHNTHPRKEQ